VIDSVHQCLPTAQNSTDMTLQTFLAFVNSIGYYV